MTHENRTDLSARIAAPHSQKARGGLAEEGHAWRICRVLCGHSDLIASAICCRSTILTEKAQENIQFVFSCFFHRKINIKRVGANFRKNSILISNIDCDSTLDVATNFITVATNFGFVQSKAAGDEPTFNVDLS